MRYSALILFALAPIAVHAQDTRSRPMDEMHGDCTNFATDLGQEFRLMASSARASPTSVSPQNAPVASPGVFDFTLHPQSLVRFAADPAQQRGGDDSFAGVVSLGNLAEGHWRISADNGAWIDLVADGDLLASPEFEMQTGCAELFKTVTFEQPARGPVLMQISGSKTAEIRITITPETSLAKLQRLIG